MKKNLEKIIVFAITIAFISITLTSTINAENTKKTSLNKITVGEDTAIYDLLIITPKEYAKNLQPLVCHKNHMGIKTKLTTLNEVHKQTYWQGRDCAEKIKYYIKNAYDNWGIQYVMLVGSFNKIPIRYVYNDEPWPGYPEPYYISDLYYADLYNNESVFQSWDEDFDGIYGEWIVNETNARDKYIDLYPDVYVGRLACRNTFEVKIMVNKIITYETKTYDSEWFNDFVVVAGDTYTQGEYPFDTSGYEGEENTLKAIENMSSFNPIKLWISNGNFTGPKDVINAINKGCGFMFFDGHASPTSWGTHPYNSHEFQYGLSNSDMWKLWNFYKLPIVVAGACHNAQFDITPLNLIKNFRESFFHNTWALECWAWKLTSKPFGGSIATIANTGLGMSKEDKKSMEGAGDFMDLQFFYVYGNNESDILGECWGKAISRYIDAYPIDWDIPDSSEYVYDEKYDLKTVQQWALLGDPSLKIGGYKID